ncbi:MAG: S8 family serine peptidase, partial [Bacteroidota bacterium]
PTRNWFRELMTPPALPWVRYVEIIDEEGKPESTEGRTIQKSNVINNSLSGGLRYDATGVHVLVRDDGVVGPHVDFQGRLTNLTTDFTGTHGDGVAGVMAGAGNIDPTVQAGASGADVTVINYTSAFQDNTLALHQNEGVVITNSSYSNGCNAGYTSTTQTVDNQVFNNQTLMHVFSAGNSNNNDCGYGAGNQWGNITGGHKMGKNVMATANLFNDGSLVSSSSRGPAHDGRIKPDIAAHGQGQMSTDPNNQYAPFGGTSSAAPSMAGNLAQLYEVYKDLNGGTVPKSSLIKAAALNSATDLGHKGPDFKYGWGMINTGRAYDIIANNQYLFANITQGQTQNHTISVPSGTDQLRVMVYWHDPAAAVNTTRALVNDLNLTVNGSILPYLLDPTPNPTNLDTPAGTGVDDLNNMEQVSIDNPTAGTYTININGFDVPQGPQEYVIVYSFIPDAIKVTYPLGGEKLVPGTSEIIHWDAFGDSGTFTVEYSTNNGGSWNSIGTTAGSERLISWTVPNIASGQALVRVTRGGQADQSDETFNIFPVPSNLSITPISAANSQVTWNAVPGATSYDVYVLGSKFMEIVGTSSTNSYSLTNMPGEIWISVAANGNNIAGQRAIAIPFEFNPTASCSGCFAQINTFPHTEGFESDLGNFCNPSSDNFDWTANSGGTPSTNTGPSSAFEGNTYLYTEASTPNHPNRTAILGSPCYDFSNALSASLSFQYHMFGAAMGSLNLEVSTNGGSSWTNVWSLSGNQGNQWNAATVDLTSYVGGAFIYRFVATTGTSWTSDFALDDIEVDAVSGNPCPGYTVTGSVQDATCNGASDGSISASAAGGIAPYSYNWSNGNTGANNSGLSAGTYTVIVSDGNNCSESASFTVNEPSPLNVTVTGTDASGGNNNGTATASASGGTPGYTYTWSNGASGATISNLAPGTYTVTTADANGCTASGSVTIIDDGSGGCVVVISDNFNSGFGNWNDGGNDCRRVGNKGVGNSPSIRLRDDTAGSDMFTDVLDLSSYSFITVSFSYITESFDNSNEDFFLEISSNGGSTYTFVEEWNLTDEFVNNVRENDIVTINGPFTANTRLRFIADASGNADRLFIDDVVVEGCTGTQSRIIAGTAPSTAVEREDNHRQVEEPTTPKEELEQKRMDLKNSFRVFPNPTDGLVNVVFSTDPKATYEVRIVNALGMLIDNRQGIQGQDFVQLNFDASTWQKGVYFVTMTDGQELQVLSLVVN